MSADLQRHPLSAAFGDIEQDEFDALVQDVKAHGLLHLWHLHPLGAIPKNLVQDVKAHGLLHPIVYVDDEARPGVKLIVDGWHRYRACVAAGVTPRFEWFEDAVYWQRGANITLVDFVVSCNAHRRHLTREQRRNIAFVAGLRPEELSNPALLGHELAKQAQRIAGEAVTL